MEFQKIFLELLENKVKEIEKNSQWVSQENENIKYLSNTDKGELGEIFLETVCKKLNYSVSRPDSKRGQFDININKKTYEVKTATLDKSNNFQFNSIRYDTKYEYLFLLGISPNDIVFQIYSKNEVVYLKLVPMAKGSNATFKHTINFKKMISINKIKEKI